MTGINRRQLAQGLGASLALARVAEATSARPEAAASSGWVNVAPGIWKAVVGTPEAYTPVVARAVPMDAKGLKALPVVGTAPIEAIRGQTGARGCTVWLPLVPGEEIYGFGLQLLSMENRGKKRTIRVNADPKLDTGDSHAPVPFYVSTQGYGVLVDSARQVEFYCGDARPKPTKAAPLVPAGVHTPENHDLMLADPGQVVVEVPRAKGVAVYLFAGPGMMEAVRRYNLFSGGGVVPPAWGLGFWYRADGKGNQTTVTALAKEFRERKIPCDVFGLEPGWHSHAYSCTYVWDKGRFPDPKTLLRDLNAQQMKVNLWEHAFTNPASPLFEPLLPHSGDYGVWGGLVPDFAGELARRVFGDYHGKELIDAGISGFKLDECDSSDYTGGWSFPDLSRFPSGIDGEQMHAVFGLRYQDAIWEQFKKRRVETYNLVRSSGALAAPYPFVLYSDLYDHRQFVRGVVTSGFSGLLWCPEVRDAKSEEDLIRRLQSVVFSPLAMVNAWYIKNPPWKQIDRKKNNADELAANWAALEERCREIIGWRMQIVPYLMAAFRKYAVDGTPPFRALLLDYPSDKRLRKVDDQYMIGDRMMVAPLFAGETERTVILPEGEWHDFWTGASVHGGGSLIVAGTIEKIPVYVKAGSLIPLAAIGASASSDESRQLTVQVYGDGALAWESGSGLRLIWNASVRRGVVEGNAAGYELKGWKAMGQR
ncbi:MAG: glycoside hydrolase family 31 [Acidobacteriaceae bacterium]|nr:glycoside hydrolase family 31 [Acidobacteriaceae bacterium]